MTVQLTEANTFQGPTLIWQCSRIQGGAFTRYILAVPAFSPEGLPRSSQACPAAGAAVSSLNCPSPAALAHAGFHAENCSH